VAFLRLKRQDLLTNRNTGHKGEEGGEENRAVKEQLKKEGWSASLTLSLSL
jgi:hypothetical protein